MWLKSVGLELDSQVTDTFFILFEKMVALYATFILMYILFCTPYSKKQQEDDLKAVQRGEGELQRLQKQLDVSEAKFASLKKLNHDMSKRFEEESARTEDGKYRLKVENQCVFSFPYAEPCFFKPI